MVKHTDTSVVTIDRYIIEQERNHPEATGELSGILYDLALASKMIANKVRLAGLVDILGAEGTENVQGEVQQKLDVIADNIIIKALDHGGRLCAMASEEQEDLIQIPSKFRRGKYVLLFDPLDGSSNIDVNVSVGTIFSIYKLPEDHTEPTLDAALQPGVRQVAAGYVVYGSSTMLVYTTGNGVNGFTLDPTIGEFLLSHPNIRTPKDGKIYSVNEGNYNSWPEGLKQCIKWMQVEDKASGRPLTSRYIGSFVSDFHRNLLKGGIYMYPPSKKSPDGKLRLMYEANPLAMVVEDAGGLATNGTQRILEIQPVALHQRTPLFIGSENLVRLVEAFLRGEKTFP